MLAADAAPALRRVGRAALPQPLSAACNGYREPRIGHAYVNSPLREYHIKRQGAD
jgi:hypothetical protein